MDLYQVNKNYQYLFHDLLDLLDSVFPDPELPTININDQDFLANLDYVLLCLLLSYNQS